ncbi:MAG: malto-oligosyltrehalose synthase [Propionicimonas sp.]
MPTPARRIPLNTYRLQLHAGFTFADALAQLDYLVELGITDLYLSPILESVPGSTHGYDVVDPGRISAERGGRDGLEALAGAAHARGLGVFVDIVPNHMAIPTPLSLNPALWSALRDGHDSPYAQWFDIEPGAQLLLPNVVLDGEDDPIPTLIKDGRLAFGDLTRPDGTTEPVLTLDGQPYPLSPGTAGLPLAEAVAAQGYALQRWQGNHTRLTHRRFFDIVTLIGVRQELPAVFDASHALLLELFEAGHLDGFRVDHPDGLADPQGYFERLSAATGGAWVVAEKILSGDELLPPAWPVAGTTGYEASWRFDAVQLDPTAAVPLAELAQRTDEQPSQTWDQVADRAKRFVAEGSLAIDVDRLIRLVGRLEPGLPAEDVRHCLTEFLVGMDRYRAYVRPGQPIGDEDAAVLATAAARAEGNLPERLRPVLARLHDLAAGRVVPGLDQPEQRTAAAEFVVRFQQVTGALLAKGVEDTAFYRWTQLLTLCDVGADPAHFGFPSPAVDPAFVHQTRGTNSEPASGALAELHDWLGRVNAGWPAGMSLGSSHDSKRSEDVRARIAVLSEYPDEWADLVTRLAPLVTDLPAPIRTILWQTLAGAWTDGQLPADRIAAYAIKAGREQKLWTSWVSPDDRLEELVAGAIPQLLENPLVRQAFTGWVELTAESVRSNTLATKLVQLTALGVADTYQGQETVRLSLTDPDNRRPVDFAGLNDLLSALTLSDGSDYLPNNGSPRQIRRGELLFGRKSEPNERQPALPVRLAEQKLLLTTLALRLRQRHPEAFRDGSYHPLTSTTDFAWGFARGGEPAAVTIATRLTRRRERAGGWQSTDRLALPPGAWRNLLTGRQHATAFQPGPDLGGWPAALLERIG